MHHRPPHHGGRTAHGVIAASSSHLPTLNTLHRPAPKYPTHDNRPSASAASAALINNLTTEDLFTEHPEARKRKFILVDDPCGKGGRVRVRVTLDEINTDEIPDGLRKSNSVFPRSWWGTEMGLHVPEAWDDDYDDSGVLEVEPDSGERRRRRRPALVSTSGRESRRIMVTVPTPEGREVQIANPRLRRSVRGKEVKLNDLGYRMLWPQSRTFSGRVVFLQKARGFTPPFLPRPVSSCPSPSILAIRSRWRQQSISTATR